MIESRAGGLPLAAHESHRVVDESLFRFLVDLEVVKAQRLQYSVAVAMLKPDLSDEAAMLAAPSVLSAVVRRTRVTDTITRLPDASFAIILVDADAADFPTILGRIRLEVGSATEMFRTPPTWSAGAASYPKTASSSADLLRIAEELFARARREGGNSVYVAP